MAAFARRGTCGLLSKGPYLVEVYINRHALHTKTTKGSHMHSVLKHIKHSTHSKLLRKPHVSYCMLMARHNSTGTEQSAAASANPDVAAPGYIPDCPLPPEPVDIVTQLNALGEPSLVSQGLGGWTPFGLIQHGLETLHVALDLPWWGAIVLGTVCLRMLVFPLVVKGQRNSAMMHNHMPTINRLQTRFTEERAAGNMMQAAKIGNEMMDYMKRNKVSPGKAFLVPLAQLPIFISVFVGLRRMANLPVESMKTGGLFWFTDLTVCDPYYILPVLTSATLLLTIELGVDGAKASAMTPTMMMVMRGMPLVMIPIIANFPAAMLVYWFTANGFSLVQALTLKIPAIKSYFDIPQMVKHDKKNAPPKKKLIQSFKETWDNSKKISSMEQRQQAEAMRFRQAGMGPIQKTYPYDPTKVKSISAKPNK